MNILSHLLLMLVGMGILFAILRHFAWYLDISLASGLCEQRRFFLLANISPPERRLLCAAPLLCLPFLPASSRCHSGAVLAAAKTTYAGACAQIPRMRWRSRNAAPRREGGRATLGDGDAGGLFRLCVLDDTGVKARKEGRTRRTQAMQMQRV